MKLLVLLIVLNSPAVSWADGGLQSEEAVALPQIELADAINAYTPLTVAEIDALSADAARDRLAEVSRLRNSIRSDGRLGTAKLSDQLRREWSWLIEHIKESGVPVGQSLENTDLTGVPKPPPRVLPTRSGKVILAFDSVSIIETIPFIIQTTGKVVCLRNVPAFGTARINLLNDEPIERDVALRMMFQSFQLAGCAVIELEDRIVLGPLDELSALAPPLLRPEVDIMTYPLGTCVMKVFKLECGDVQSIAPIIKAFLPDWSTLAVDVPSQRIIVQADVDFCRRVQMLINELEDVEAQ